MNSLNLTIRGIAPLIMHNGQLSDPLNDFTKALSRLTKKKNKTDDDHLAVRKAEWYGGLYVDENGRPGLPGEVLEAVACEGAKRLKLGKVAKGGLIIDGFFHLEYKGPKHQDDLWKDGGFIKLASVRNQQNRVIRSRPIFSDWGCTFDVQWDPEFLKDEDEVLDIFEHAGKCGVGDWRPKFGRFEVES